MAVTHTWKNVLLVLGAVAYWFATAGASDALKWPQWLGAAVAGAVGVLVILVVPRLRMATHPDFLFLFTGFAVVALFLSLPAYWPPWLEGLATGITVLCCWSVVLAWRRGQVKKQSGSD